MEGNYVLNLGGQAVGKVQVIREGLYYRFCCRCELPGEVVSKVVVSCGGREESLGILVPMGKGFGLDTRMPVKRFAVGQPAFSVLPKRVSTEGKFVPLKPEEPFSYIARLKDAYLASHSGQIGLIIK